MTPDIVEKSTEANSTPTAPTAIACMVSPASSWWKPRSRAMKFDRIVVNIEEAPFLCE
jgi:hypothetical protein